MKIRLVAPLVALVLLVGAALPAAAQRPISDQVAIDIGLVEISGKPGGQSGDRFKLINRTDVPVDVTAFVEDLGTNANGDLVAVPRGSTDLPSAARWVEIADEDLTVPANATATVDALIKVPAGTKAGGYYATITFDADDSQTPESRLTHVILVRIDGAGFAPNGRVVSIRMVTPSFSGRVPIEVTVENGGNLHAVGGGSIDITDTFGSRIARIPIPTVVVLPQRQRVVKVFYDSPPVAARLKATANVKFRNSESSATDAGYVLIWWLAAMLVAVLLLFAVSLIRVAGLAGPKAAARRAARAPAPVPVTAAPAAAPKPKRRDRKRADEAAAAATEAAPQQVLVPPLPPAPVAGAPEPAVPPRHDESFWGPDDDEAPAPRVRDEPEVEPVEVEKKASPFDSWTLDDEEGLGEELLERDAEDDDAGVPAAAAAERPADDLDDDDDEFDLDRDLDEDEDGDGDTDDDERDDELDDDGHDDDEQDDDEPAGDDEVDLWPDSEPASRPAPVASSRPVPVVVPSGRTPAAAPQQPAARDEDDDDDDEPAPMRPALRPAVKPHEVRVAGLPPLREREALPDTAWGTSLPDQPLERVAGGSGMALRRAEVAIRMISGKPGETGAILDSGLDLLYSVRNDAAVVERVEQAYEETRNRRKLGPLALALFAVDSRSAPEALLDSFATASKVVAERIRRAILACDPADIRPHRALIQALPQARRDQIGL